MFSSADSKTGVHSLVECLCFAGILFGWASLVFVFKSDGYFSYLCINSTVNETTTKDCTKQDEQYTIIFTIASFLNNFLTLPNGFIFDHFGTMVTRLLAISVYTTGTLLIAFSNAALSVLLYPALSLIAVGGILLLVTNMQVGNLFGSHRSTVITLYNGAFDSSSAVFLIVKLLYQDGVSLRYSLIFLSCCSAIHLIRTFLLMPRRHIPFPLPENFNYGLRCGGAQTSSESENVSGKRKIQNYEATEISANKDKSTKTNNPDISGQSESEADKKAAILSLFLTVVQCVLFSLCAAIPVLPLQYLTFVLQVLNRSFLYGGNAAFISVAFPPAHFGKLYGTMMSLSAVVSLLQYPCFAIISGPLDGNPFAVNVALTILSCLAFIHPIYVYLHCKRQAAQRAKAENTASS
ncbi:hypothetical protein QTP70_016824 [Hemibagrus guttatus]|uniref:Solute carrier family 43 member 3 n=1 Tax=Hemibagrus guttatus TaxID=175788 RepID=A0AAE0QWL9_9TELE|nr:hypothetical protein QTP70_016824 [Hemibagrus guttatus]